jgi:hypothetical protein
MSEYPNQPGEGNARSRRGVSWWTVVFAIAFGACLGGAAWWLEQQRAPSLPDAILPSSPSTAVTETPDTEAALPSVDPTTGLTADAIARMPLMTFVARHTVRSRDDSEAGLDEAHAVFARYVQHANDRRAQDLSPEHRQLFLETRVTLQQWDTAMLDLGAAANGGGTLYAHARIRDAALIEALLSEVVATLLPPTPTDAHARAAAMRVMEEIQREVMELARVHPAENPQQYRLMYSALRDELRPLRSLVQRLPDRAALQVAEYARDLFSYLGN